ncbi:MAG: glutamine amidotransferase, partial [Ruthenibacterium sp.]
YDAVFLSDVGANTFLLHEDTFYAGKTTVNKLDLIKDYVADGGAFGMIGGYLTFQGIQAKGNYKGTIIEEILPVTLSDKDDRVELPQGYAIKVDGGNHPIMQGIPEKFPLILGYNKLSAKEHATVLASRNEDALISVWEYGKGRTLAYATDCSPHWASMELCEWQYYPVLWQNIVKWLANK